MTIPCKCGYFMVPVYFNSFDDAGRPIIMCDYLLCDSCGKREIVDDYFDIKPRR